MEIFATRLDMIVTHIGGLPIEFDFENLNNILGIQNARYTIYASQKALSFDNFTHCEGVRNICCRRDLTSDICVVPFQSQLLPLQVRIVHIITHRKGHSNEVTRLDVGLLDSRPIKLGYVILQHMLSTPAVNHRLLCYGNIISKILRHFHVPL